MLAFCIFWLAPAPAGAVDSRIEKAREIREQILLKRRELEQRAQPRQEDPFEAAVAAARQRLAEVDAQIAERQRRSQEMAVPREKLRVRSEELAASVARLQQENRARVEAIYRSARLGTGAAGWHAEPARGVRLSRYLAQVATVQQARVEVVEVEYGSVLASLDRERAGEAAAAAELRVLEADRAEAEARLQQAIVEARPGGSEGLATAGSPFIDDGFAAGAAEGADEAVDGAADAAADEVAAEAAMQAAGEVADQAAAAGEAAGRAAGEAATPLDETAPERRDPAADRSFEQPDEDAAAVSGDEPSEEALIAAARGGPLPGSGTDEETALAVERALARLAEHNAQKAAEPPPAMAAAPGGEFTWSDGTAPGQAAAAGDDRNPEERAAAGAVTDPAANAAEPADLARERQAADPAATDPAASAADSTANATRPAASESEQAPDAPGDAPASDAQPEPRRRGFLSRIFASDRQADEFASSRGELRPPVAGKVVANYGQQHKSGATYRGVILRAAHNDPVKAVAGGKVSFAGVVPGLGNTVIVSHGGRYHTVYARLGSLDVKEGDSVGGGSRLGQLPDDNADMHFELRDGGKAIDPLPWLRGVPGAAPQ